MPESRDHRSVVEAAEKAAGDGDYATAERLLREAAALQEANLGPQHSDLANTLNNLGIVCEITQKPEDAERFFRRAYGIAAATLKPDHPFVTTSRKNLEDFCRARGKPVDLPPAKAAAPPPVPVEKKKPLTRPAEVPRARKTSEPPSPVVAAGGLPSPVAIGILVAIALVVTFIATPLFRSNDAAESPASNSETAPPPSPAPAPVDNKTKPTAPAQKPAAAVAPSTARRAEKESGRAALAAPVLVEARLCRNLATDDDWECVSPRSPVGAGPLFFYTRLKSPTDTTVQHRWYRGNRVRQVVELRVRANTDAGYRTFSRNTINDLDQADWRVELTTSDGTLLKEIRFTVR
ncbi:MAG TPA: DUF2914 domain-containing protein [Vicinamibacterales bacterium]|jgi:hypothetical protein|nr:DUF2914 domain-containing protein [Vicinamibacterales bacterium]